MSLRWLLIGFIVLASCNSSKKTVKKEDKGPAVENALLWSVSGKGLASPSYLYGTIHMICKQDFLFSNTLRQKISESKNIYLELDMDDPSMMIKMATLAIMKDKTLKDLMSAADYKTVSDYVKDSLGMPMMLFNRMKPITLMSLIYTKVLPCSSTESYEGKFVELAKAQKKEVLGLETIEDQMGVFDKIPDSVEAQMILEMIRTMPEQRKQMAEMVESYKKENIQQLADQMSESPEWKGFEDILLANRNRNWISIMESAMKQGPQIFAVGAGHLPGKDGVINLLRAAGYTVTPVKQSFGETAKN
ncbi:MAG TPA: TraB/GumN family protein [Chitinophagaceae bacterium]|nr:TraB/GumN family protein [Chitinophagaceae bacterium]